jgi:hypothetical protein
MPGCFSSESADERFVLGWVARRVRSVSVRPARCRVLRVSPTCWCYRAFYIPNRRSTFVRTARQCAGHRGTRCSDWPRRVDDLFMLSFQNINTSPSSLCALLSCSVLPWERIRIAIMTVVAGPDRRALNGSGRRYDDEARVRE